MIKDERRGGARTSWARLLTARPRLSLLLTLLIVALAAVAGSGVADRLGNGGWEDPAAESSYAANGLERYFADSQPNLVVLLNARGQHVDSAEVTRQARALRHQLAADDAVTGVVSYWDGRAGALRSQDGHEAMLTARIRGDETAADRVFDRLEPALHASDGPAQVRLGGPVAVRHEMQQMIEEDLLRAELIALPVTLVLLVLVFGSLVAALLPLAVGVFAILGTNAVLRVLTGFTDVSIFAQNLTTALGLGLAIDYALFIVRRFREETDQGADASEAVARTLRTAGRTVLFSALTVAVSLSALLIFPQYFLRSFAYAGVAVVVLAALAALVVLPAALVLLGPRVNAGRVRRPGRGRSDPGEGRGWLRLSRGVMRFAPVVTVLAVAGLLVLGLPFLQVQFGNADERQLPSSAESRSVQDDIRAGFPGSPGNAVEVLAEGAAVHRSVAVETYARKLSRIPGVTSVTSPVGEHVEGARTRGPSTADRAREGTDAAYVTVLREGAAADLGGQELVREIRKLDAPFKVSVAGRGAVIVDSKAAIGERLPWAVGLIVVVTLTVVFLMTGSVLVPLQAVLLNSLSLTAMYGAVVWVFQEGHFSGALGFTATGDIETTLPVLMFCVAFGLSMDYGVFLLSRIKEEYDRTGEHRASIAYGLQRTGGLITAAALILAVVMVAIGTSRVTNTKMLGLGIALAVLMDAAVVRTLLVPAVMRFTGRATWWAPRQLRLVQSRFGLHEQSPTDTQQTAPEGRPEQAVPSKATEGARS